IKNNIHLHPVQKFNLPLEILAVFLFEWVVSPAQPAIIRAKRNFRPASLFQSSGSAMGSGSNSSFAVSINYTDLASAKKDLPPHLLFACISTIFSLTYRPLWKTSQDTTLPLPTCFHSPAGLKSGSPIG